MRDADVRKAMRVRLAAEHVGDDDTRIVEEMGVWNGAVRVDLAVINGELVGYEIKSARDTLARLPNQVSLYNMVFDRVHLITAKNHLAHALDEIPDWWGVILARLEHDEVSLDLVRCGKENPAVEPIQVARLLWRDEALAILGRLDAVRGVRSATREKIAMRLVEILSLNELRKEVRRCLKGRQAWLGQPVGDQRHMAVGCEA